MIYTRSLPLKKKKQIAADESENTPEADIGMIFEGSYPYVSGGVSAWAQQLITSLPQLTFSVITILPDEKPRELKYPIPGNVVNLHHVYIHRDDFPKRLHTFKKYKWSKPVEEFHRKMFKRDIRLFPSMIELFAGSNSPTIDQLINSRTSFDILKRMYKNNADGSSFLDYFWTWRFMHLGLFWIMKAPLFHCRLYHAISTGYCGIYGAILKQHYKKPYLLTEHGIYTRERKVEISQSDWIYDSKKEDIRPERTLGVFKNMWFKAFSMMSQITYQYADEIITLYPGNQIFQREDSANQDKQRVIYNGIDFNSYNALKKKRSVKRFTVALIGRVVQIKDVKTFLRCVKILSYKIPDITAFILGPKEEEPEYYQECQQVVRLLGIEKIVKFTGKVKVIEYYDQIDLIMLSSISEAQPLVILEANAAGIPVVATDVGDCRGLLYGREEVKEDFELGQSGFVFNIANPEDAAEYVYTLYKDLLLYKKFSEAGMKRTARFYRKEYEVKKYLNLYLSYIRLSEKLNGRNRF